MTNFRSGLVSIDALELPAGTPDATILTPPPDFELYAVEAVRIIELCVSNGRIHQRVQVRSEAWMQDQRKRCERRRRRMAESKLRRSSDRSLGASALSPWA